MNQEKLDELRDWAFSGERCVKIEFKNRTGGMEVKIWCYDYSLIEGRLINEDQSPPTTEDLLNDKRKAAQAILDSL